VYVTIPAQQAPTVATPVSTRVLTTFTTMVTAPATTSPPALAASAASVCNRLASTCEPFYSKIDNCNFSWTFLTSFDLRTFDLTSCACKTSLLTIASICEVDYYNGCFNETVLVTDAPLLRFCDVRRSLQRRFHEANSSLEAAHMSYRLPPARRTTQARSPLPCQQQQRQRQSRSRTLWVLVQSLVSLWAQYLVLVPFSVRAGLFVGEDAGPGKMSPPRDLFQIP
jgi:hypothetical protein